MEARVAKNGPDVMRYVEKQIVLQVLDTCGASTSSRSTTCAR